VGPYLALPVKDEQAGQPVATAGKVQDVSRDTSVETQYSHRSHSILLEVLHMLLGYLKLDVPADTEELPALPPIDKAAPSTHWYMLSSRATKLGSPAAARALMVPST
jgi:hypothetical protein